MSNFSKEHVAKTNTRIIRKLNRFILFLKIESISITSPIKLTPCSHSFANFFPQVVKSEIIVPLNIHCHGIEHVL